MGSELLAVRQQIDQKESHQDAQVFQDVPMAVVEEEVRHMPPSSILEGNIDLDNPWRQGVLAQRSGWIESVSRRPWLPPLF